MINEGIAEVKMKAAAIDIGTNSVRLLLANIDGQSITGEKSFMMTRIGEGVHDTKRLGERGMADTLEALKTFKEKAEVFGAQSIHVMATSAVRDAKNRDEFIKRASSIGIDIEVLPGEVEAEIGYLGVQAGRKQKESLLVIDIGGGSTELIVGDAIGVCSVESYNVGAVRMTDKHLPSTLVSDQDKIDLDKDVEQILRSGIQQIKRFPIKRIIGIGGTATTFASIRHGLAKYDRKKVHGTILKTDYIDFLNTRFKQSKVDDRKAIVGLDPKRADIIYAGGEILSHILHAIGAETIEISDYDNLEGYLYKKLSL